MFNQLVNAFKARFISTSAPLSVPRSGGTKMNLTNGDGGGGEGMLGPTEQVIAAWQTTEDGTEGPGHYSAPKRVVIRCDGDVCNQGRDISGNQGFPAAVLQIRYTIGTLVRQVLVDCVNQSALVVWAQSVDVKTVWDRRRVSRMGIQHGETPGILPCASQDLAAAISACECGDSGVADARWLDCLAVDDTDGITYETSIHPIPDGARGFRFLDALVGGTVVSTPGLTTKIVFTAGEYANLPAGFVEAVTNGATDTTIIAVPVTAKYLILYYPAGTIATFDTPAWLEWLIAPNTLPVLS